MLWVVEAARMRMVCKALRASVREWPMRLGSVGLGNLQAALTCFTSTESFRSHTHAEDLIWHVPFTGEYDSAEESRLVELLRGHGRTLKRVDSGEGTSGLLASAVRAGALPNLTYFNLSLDHIPIDREILSGGMLRLLEEVEVGIKMDDEEQVAALEHLRRLPHLRSLRLRWFRGDPGAALPPFIPPSLKTLELSHLYVASLKSLLRQLPSMLRASGANLEEFRLELLQDLPAECAALAQVLRACSSTLKTVWLRDSDCSHMGPACIRELAPALISCCATLEYVHCPWALFSALPATVPSFTRLTRLELWGSEAKGPVDPTSSVWDIMANGRLPALKTLDIRKIQLTRWEEGQGGSRMARAFEAVTGTLRKLDLVAISWDALPVGASYEVGAAIGKLRRLRYLFPDLFVDGRDYHAMGRGMAASGGCPDLFELIVQWTTKNVDWLTHEPGLVVPSVRNLSIAGRCTEEEALLFCCGLAQAGYQHQVTVALCDHDDQELPDAMVACMRAILGGGGMNADVSLDGLC
jgi:hypothetical protein